MGTYVLLSFRISGPVKPEWMIGLACGIGGLVGGYVGAWLQPHLREALLRVLLGAVATGLAILYLLQASGVFGR